MQATAQQERTPRGISRRTPAVPRPIRGLAKLCLSFLIGATALLLTRVLVFHSTAIALNSPAGLVFLVTGDIVLALGFSLLCLKLLGLKGARDMWLVGAGLVAMMVGEPAVASRLPTVWATLYSATHVQNLLRAQTARDVTLEPITTTTLDG